MWRRLSQLWAALTARISPLELAEVRRRLPASELPLFERMPLRDQRHCLDVYATLVAGGVTDPLLLRAALFHDTGKVDRAGRPVPLLLYGLLVVFKRLWPRSYARLAASPQGLRHWVHQYAHHGPLGAHMAAEAGAPPEIVAILQHYHDDQPTGPAAILQWADEQH